MQKCVKQYEKFKGKRKTGETKLERVKLTISTLSTGKSAKFLLCQKKRNEQKLKNILLAYRGHGDGGCGHNRNDNNDSGLTFNAYMTIKMECNLLMEKFMFV